MIVPIYQIFPLEEYSTSIGLMCSLYRRAHLWLLILNMKSKLHRLNTRYFLAKEFYLTSGKPEEFIEREIELLLIELYSGFNDDMYFGLFSL